MKNFIAKLIDLVVFMILSSVIIVLAHPTTLSLITNTEIAHIRDRSNNPQEGGNGLSAGSIAGIVLGGCTGLAMIFWLAYCCTTK